MAWLWGHGCGSFTCSVVNGNCDSNLPAQPREAGSQRRMAATRPWPVQQLDGVPAGMCLCGVDTEVNVESGGWEKVHSLVMLLPLFLTRQEKPQTTQWLAAPSFNQAMPSAPERKIN